MNNYCVGVQAIYSGGEDQVELERPKAALKPTKPGVCEKPPDKIKEVGKWKFGNAVKDRGSRNEFWGGRIPERGEVHLLDGL